MGHPLTAENLAALETLLGRRMERVIEVEACVDLEQALALTWSGRRSRSCWPRQPSTSWRQP